MVHSPMHPAHNIPSVMILYSHSCDTFQVLWLPFKERTVSVILGDIEADLIAFDLISMAAILTSHSHIQESQGFKINPYDFLDFIRKISFQ